MIEINQTIQSQTRIMQNYFSHRSKKIWQIYEAEWENKIQISKIWTKKQTTKFELRARNSQTRIEFVR